MHLLIQSRLGRLCCLLMLFAAVPAGAQYTNGIYAEFNTSMGSFTCRLEYAVAPKAVANFIGLATGERAWLDLPSGIVKTNPFFNGTTFHRVIGGFMNQGGSPNGQGTDGPGYQFEDEFNAGFLHDRFGVLSMANSGPDSNGSQFFITVSPQAHLNGVHTVFGRLHGGSNVVYAINHVATGGNDKPLTNVVIQSVVIRRSGSEAQAFNIHGQGLPVITHLPLKVTTSGSNLGLAFSNRLSVENVLYNSTNLTHWRAESLGFETGPAPAQSVSLAGGLPAQFFRMDQVQYPGTLFVPRSPAGKVIGLTFSGSGTFWVSFENPSSPAYMDPGGTVRSVTAVSWKQDPYRGRFPLLWLGPYVPMALHLDFDSATNGTFKGSQYPYYPAKTNAIPVSGIFTCSP